MAARGPRVTVGQRLPQQVQRPPPLELPALNGRSLSPDASQRQRSVSPPLDSTPPAASSAEQRRLRILPQPPAEAPANIASQQLERATSPRAASLARPAVSVAPGQSDMPKQQPQQQQQQQALLPPQPQQAPMPASPSQRLRASQVLAAGNAVEAPHARTPGARRELAAIRDAAAASGMSVAAVALQPGGLPGSPLPGHDKVQPHDRALLAAAAAQVRLLDAFLCAIPSSCSGDASLRCAPASQVCWHTTQSHGHHNMQSFTPCRRRRPCHGRTSGR